MRQMGYTSCTAHPNLWLKAKPKPDKNVCNYAYILCYIDDILCIHHNPMSVLNEINGYLLLKPSLVGDPDIYLGAKLKQTLLPDGVWAWGLSPSKYVAQAVKNCQMHLTEELGGKYKIPVKADNPFPVYYDSLTDLSDPLDAKCPSFYQHLIGVM